MKFIKDRDELFESKDDSYKVLLNADYGHLGEWHYDESAGNSLNNVLLIDGYYIRLQLVNHNDFLDNTYITALGNILKKGYTKFMDVYLKGLDINNAVKKINGKKYKIGGTFVWHHGKYPQIYSHFTLGSDDDFSNGEPNGNDSDFAVSFTKITKDTAEVSCEHIRFKGHHVADDYPKFTGKFNLATAKKFNAIFKNNEIYFLKLLYFIEDGYENPPLDWLSEFPGKNVDALVKKYMIDANKLNLLPKVKNNVSKGFLKKYSHLFRAGNVNMFK